MSAKRSVAEESRLQGYEHGYREGHEAGLKFILTLLEDKYINDPNRPDRGSVEGDAILALASECGQVISSRLKELHRGN